MPWKLKRPQLKFERRLRERVKNAEEQCALRDEELKTEAEKLREKVKEHEALIISHAQRVAEVADLQGKLMTSSRKNARNLQLWGEERDEIKKECDTLLESLAVVTREKAGIEECGQQKIEALENKVLNLEATVAEATTEKREIEERGQRKIAELVVKNATDGGQAQEERTALQERIRHLEAAVKVASSEKRQIVERAQTNIAEHAVKNATDGAQAQVERTALLERIRHLEAAVKVASSEKRQIEEDARTTIAKHVVKNSTDGAQAQEERDALQLKIRDLEDDGAQAQEERAALQKKIYDTEATISKLEKEKVIHDDKMAELLEEVAKLGKEAIAKSEEFSDEEAKFRRLLNSALRTNQDKSDMIRRLEKEAEASRKSHKEELEICSRSVQRVQAEQKEFQRQLMREHKEMANDFKRLSAMMEDEQCPNEMTGLASACEQQPKAKREPKVRKKKLSKTNIDETPADASKVMEEAGQACAVGEVTSTVVTDDDPIPKVVTFAEELIENETPAANSTVGPRQKQNDVPAPILKKTAERVQEIGERENSPIAKFDVDKIRKDGENYSGASFKKAECSKSEKELEKENATDEEQAQQPEASWQTVSHHKSPRRSSAPLALPVSKSKPRRKDIEKRRAVTKAKLNGHRRTQTKQPEEQKKISLEADFPPLASSGTSLLNLIN